MAMMKEVINAMCDFSWQCMQFDPSFSEDPWSAVLCTAFNLEIQGGASPRTPGSSLKLTQTTKVARSRMFSMEQL
jgi:hypothetical protein